MFFQFFLWLLKPSSKRRRAKQDGGVEWILGFLLFLMLVRCNG